ncbi:Voltage-dependent calcium channel subunit alpha-2/delta-4 [Chionoecetes opilio]|uniref:Voltage-dependent calcium channel subunit alpha-2/delta-4 n=1 Tax=Chionoecetes opilio TaxID=41210 RepID=A0A8J5CZR2_CHIOP|nr:Voltage-dependent calcium channel subunit alpha-2/delta-4 [Chionoecetes opilio]
MDEKDPDLYDARLRSWYIQAASSPKDMVILLDVSGSMTGLRKEIAKHVVLNILETLNENDFVNIFDFSAHTTELVSCFKDSLVQANLENIGEFKKALKNIETKEIANFTQALTTAFELLQRYNKSGQGSQCNQAIMLVTDGAPYNFEEIFSKYNWPHLQVRVFTYLIGREEKKVRDLYWMACANKGYFVHVTTLAEVREQVLKYIPVMARPMVMYQNEHPHIWTGVYADVARWSALIGGSLVRQRGGARLRAKRREARGMATLAVPGREESVRAAGVRHEVWLVHPDEECGALSRIHSPCGGGRSRLLRVGDEGEEWP